MERLTQYDSNNNAESYIAEFDNINIYEGGMEGKYISGRQITRLAEYENISLTPKEIVEMRDDAVNLFNENKELKHELEVYKKALHTALEECRYIEIEENVMPNYLEEARKELEK